MCGRFTQTASKERVAEHFGMDPNAVPDLTPRYNIAPSQPIPVVGLKGDGKTLGLAHLKWGLVPKWSDDPDRGIRPTNARSDSLGKPTFATLFATQRCLVAADGFYEWLTEGSGKSARKIPMHFSLASGDVFALAALWSFWTDGTRKVTTCCLITTDANDVVGQVHDRMPVVIPGEQYRRWLSNETPAGDLRAMLRPYPAGELVSRVADVCVNKAGVEGPQCWGLAAVMGVQ